MVFECSFPAGFCTELLRQPVPAPSGLNKNTQTASGLMRLNVFSGTSPFVWSALLVQALFKSGFDVMRLCKSTSLWAPGLFFGPKWGQISPLGLIKAFMVLSCASDASRDAAGTSVLLFGSRMEAVGILQ